MESHFTVTRKSSKAVVVTGVSAQPRKLEASSLDAATAEVQRIADEEIGTMALHFVMAGTSSHMRTIRPSKLAVTEYKAWLAQRAEGGR